MIRSLRPRQLAVDVGVAVLCVLARLAVGVDGPTVFAVVVVMGLALALRRVSPALALVAAWLGVTAQLLALLPADPANLAVLAVLYCTARYGTPVVKWAGFGSAALGAVVATSYLTVRPYVGGLDVRSASEIAANVVLFFATTAATFFLSWTLGVLVRTRADARASRRRELEARWRGEEAQRRGEAAERREEAERHSTAIERERTRIARDMHDVVAHSLAVVIAQADGARYARATDPGAVDTALDAISTTARDALGDVRALLAQLRRDDVGGHEPALVDLDRLVDQVRASGLPVTVNTVGTQEPLPAGAQIALFRIVQEALTNALRHGSAEGADVRFDWGRDAVSVRVSNPLDSAADSAARESSGGEPTVGAVGTIGAVGAVGGGHGLAGMRERAVLAGGSFSAERRGEYFVVNASIPLARDGAAS